jgi:uncharacterized protein YbaP (TraB family)
LKYGSIFIIVGAWHLIGKKDIIEMPGAKGNAVERF